MMKKSLITLGAAVVLSACAGNDPLSGLGTIFAPTPQPAASAPPTSATPTITATPNAVEPPPPPTVSADPPPSAPPPNVAALPPATPEAFFLRDARAMAGLSSTDILARFGRPFARRIEGPREVWQYRSNACVMLVHFRKPDGGGEPRIDHVDLLATRTTRGLWMQAPQGVPRAQDEPACITSHQKSG